MITSSQQLRLALLGGALRVVMLCAAPLILVGAVVLVVVE